MLIGSVECETARNSESYQLHDNYASKNGCGYNNIIILNLLERVRLILKSLCSVLITATICENLLFSILSFIPRIKIICFSDDHLYDDQLDDGQHNFPIVATEIMLEPQNR